MSVDIMWLALGCLGFFCLGLILATAFWDWYRTWSKRK